MGLVEGRSLYKVGRLVRDNMFFLVAERRKNQSTVTT